MHVLLLNQFFAPDPAPTGQLLADVARGLSEQGYSVSVICSSGRYASAEVEIQEMPGIEVQRVRCTPFGRGHAARALSYASFFFSAFSRSLFGRRPDVIVTLTTPPLLSLAGTMVKQLRGAKHVIWEMDVFPDVAVALNVFAAGSLLDRISSALADLSRRRSDRVVVLGPCMRDCVERRGIPAAKLSVAENWVSGLPIHERPLPEAPPLVVLYSGNFGMAHDVETIAQAMTRLRDPADYRFVFAGGGIRHAPLQARCQAGGLVNVLFLAYRDAADLVGHFASCHIGLVTQEDAALGCVVPSKCYPFLSAGRPFLFVGPAQATPALLIERYGCGWRIAPGDIDALTALLQRLAAEPELVRVAGRRARETFVNRYDRHAGVSRILSVLAKESYSQVDQKHPVQHGI